MNRNIIRGAVVAAMLAPAAIIGASSASAVPSHVCPLDGAYEKVESGNMDDVVLGEGIRFCVKAAKQQSGYLIADGTTPLSGYVTWTNNGGQHPAVSHYVLYEDDELTAPPAEEEEPTVTPPKGPVAPHKPAKTKPEKPRKLIGPIVGPESEVPDVVEVAPLPKTGMGGQTAGFLVAGAILIGTGAYIVVRYGKRD